MSRRKKKLPRMISGGLSTFKSRTMDSKKIPKTVEEGFRRLNLKAGGCWVIRIGGGPTADSTWFACTDSSPISDPKKPSYTAQTILAVVRKSCKGEGV